MVSFPFWNMGAYLNSGVFAIMFVVVYNVYVLFLMLFREERKERRGEVAGDDQLMRRLDA